MSLPPALMRPHFWSTADKETLSRIINQAVVDVSRDSQGDVCSIPVVAPKFYQERDTASYNVLATHMVEAIKENFSVEILWR